MLTEFLIAFPLFLFAFLGLTNLSEWGYLVSVADLASFHAARARFVEFRRSGDTDEAVGRLLEKSLSPSRNPGFNVGFQGLGIGSQAEVKISPPPLLPYASCIGDHESLEGKTVVPNRGASR